MAAVTELCNDLCSGEQVKAYQARQALTKLCYEVGASGRESDKTATAQELAKFLAKTKPAKDNRGEATVESINTSLGATDVCRALASVGGDAEVAAVAECLKNIDLREAARWCLTRMNCQAATDALVAALQTAAGTEFRVGLINALAKKNGSATVEALRAATTDNEPEVRLAAAEALAQVPDAALDALIAATATGASTRRAARTVRARMRLAETLLRTGQKDAAKTVFAAIASADVPVPQKKAAAAAVATL